jgi:hypothetical protein
MLQLLYPPQIAQRDSSDEQISENLFLIWVNEAESHFLVAEQICVK